MIPPKFHLIPPKFCFSPTWRIKNSHVEIRESLRGYRVVGSAGASVSSAEDP